MTIFYIFMGLSVLVGVITWFVITSDKRKVRKKEIYNQQEEQPKGKKVKNIKNIWDIEDIRDGVIHLTDNKYAAVVKMGSIDVWLLSAQEQESVEDSLIQLALSLNFPVRFYSTTDYVDTTQTQLAIHEALNNNDFPPKMMTYAQNVLNSLEELRKSKSVYTRKDYAVVFYEGEAEKAYSELDRRCMTIINALRRANVTAERVNSDEILNMLHNSLNKRSVFKPSNAVQEGAFELYVTGVQASAR